MAGVPGTEKKASTSTPTVKGSPLPLSKTPPKK